jgi:hypothetical protein
MLITRQNYETFFLLYVDNELSALERKMVENFASLHQDLEIELQRFVQTRFTADESMVFINKASLLQPTVVNDFIHHYRSEPTISKNNRNFFLGYWKMATAAAVLLMIGLFVLMHNRSATKQNLAQLPAKQFLKKQTGLNEQPILNGQTVLEKGKSILKEGRPQGLPQPKHANLTQSTTLTTPATIVKDILNEETSVTNALPLSYSNKQTTMQVHKQVTKTKAVNKTPPFFANAFTIVEKQSSIKKSEALVSHTTSLRPAEVANGSLAPTTISIQTQNLSKLLPSIVTETLAIEKPQPPMNNDAKGIQVLNLTVDKKNVLKNIINKTAKLVAKKNTLLQTATRNTSIVVGSFEIAFN